MAPSWGICATVKAPADQVLAFVAHHLSQGADVITICLDDPGDPVFETLATLDHVRPIRCEADWWAFFDESRPDRHQVRQLRNINRILRRTRLDWIANIDVDEFLLAAEPVATILARVPRDQPMLRLPPFEALHDPDLPDDIFTARYFRGAMPGSEFGALRRSVLQDYAPLLPRGTLSHSHGKYLFRSGIPGLQARLHSGILDDRHVEQMPADPALDLLHFHAEDRAAWLETLPFRLTRGAYQFNEGLRDYLSRSTPEEIAAFYDAVQTATPDARAALRKAGILREAELGLAARVAALLGKDGPGPQARCAPDAP